MLLLELPLLIMLHFSLATGNLVVSKPHASKHSNTCSTCDVSIHLPFISELFYALFRSVGANRSEPSVDPNQDVTMTRAEHIDGRTIIYFTRARITSDPSPVDIALDHPVYMLWAVGPITSFNPPVIGMHGGTDRGSSMERVEFPSAAECPFIGKNHTVAFSGI